MADEPKSRRRQYSLIVMFGVVTATAIVLGVCRALGLFNAPPVAIAILAAMFITVAAIELSAIWLRNLMKTWINEPANLPMQNRDISSNPEKVENPIP